MKTELLNGIADVVCTVCEVSKEELCSMRKYDYIVEARSIFVTYCLQYGLSAVILARFLNRKRVVSIYECERNYAIYRRQSYSFRCMCEEVSNILANKYPRS